MLSPYRLFADAFIQGIGPTIGGVAGGDAQLGKTLATQGLGDALSPYLRYNLRTRLKNCASFFSESTRFSFFLKPCPSPGYS